MDENLHNIEALFYAQLEDNEILPSENTWNEIDKQLDKDNLVSIKKKNSFLKKITALLLLLLSFFTLFELINMYKNNSTKYDYVEETNKTHDTENGNNKNEDLINKANKKNIFNDKNLTEYSDINKTENSVNSNTTSINKITVQNKESQIQSPYQPYRKYKFTSEKNFKVDIHAANASSDNEKLNELINENKIPFLRNKKDISAESLLPLTGFTFSLKYKIIPNKNIAITWNDISSLKEKKDKKQSHSRFSLTPFFSPDIAWYNLEDDEQGANIENANEIDKEEKNEFSFSYGVMADYKINKHWGIQSGVTVSNTNITTDPKQIYAQPDNTGNIKYRINTSSGYGYILPSFSTNPATGDSIYAFTSSHKLQYVGIPLAVTYNVQKGKFNFKTLTGVSANILIKAKLETTVEKGFNNELETVDNIQGLKKIYFSGLAGVGVDYKLNTKISLILSPTLRFAINSINKDAAVKTYPVSLGFNTGIKIGL